MVLRFLTAGESHGPGLVTIVDGLPAGLEIVESDFADELARRRQGHGRGARMKIEADELEILGGIRGGKTLGSPVAVVVRNTEWEKWEKIMSPQPGAKGGSITRPRPGHADLVGMMKYDTLDARDVLERASARETAARTIAGVLARKLLKSIGIEILSHVTRIGHVVARAPVTDAGAAAEIDESPVRCADDEASKQMVEAIDEAAAAKDTLGGTFRVEAHDVMVGLGSYVQHDRRLDALLAGAMLSIPSVKAVAIGDGFEIGGRRGTQAHDEIDSRDGELVRLTNRAGGIEGGVSNGETILVDATMKPISTLMQPLQTVDVVSGEAAQAVRERSDVCAVPAGAVVGEQMVAWVLAVESMRKFGGDTIEDLASSVDAYRSRVASRFGD